MQTPFYYTPYRFWKTSFFKLSFIVFLLSYPLLHQAQIPDTSIARQLMERSEKVMVDSGLYQLALELAQEAQGIYTAALGPLDTLVAETHLYQGESYFYLEAYDQAIESFLEEGNIYHQLDNVTSMLIANNLNNLGMCHEYRGDYQKAFDCYQKSILIYQQSTHEDAVRNLAYTQSNLAIIYNRMGNYHKGLQFFEQTLQVELQIPDYNELEIASSYTNIGLTHEIIGKYDKALELLNKALAIRLRKQDKNVYRMARLYGNIGLCYLKKGDYDKALEFCEKDLLTKLQKTDPNDNVVATPLTNVGKCYREKGDYKSARKYLNQALAVRQRKYAPFHSYVVKIQVELSDLDVKEGAFDTAIKRMDEALAGVLDGKKIDDFKNLEKPLRYLSVLIKKGDAHFAFYKKTKDQRQLLQALKVYEPALQLIDFLRTGLDEEASKEVLLHNNYALYGKVIDIYYELFQTNQDIRFVHSAFDVAEKGKSALLLEAVKTTYAKNFAGINPDLLEKERQLKVDIAFYEKQRFEADKQGDESAKNNIVNELFDLKLEYENLIQRFEKDFPTYFQLKYNTQNASIVDLQQQFLDDKTSLINYFTAENKLFTFVLNKNTIEFFRQEIEQPLQATVKDFIDSIADYPKVTGAEKTLFENIYVDKAYALYQLLIEPIEVHLHEKLIIIPHDLLGYIPFECLLKTRPEDNFSFRSHPYLLHDYQMSYSYSANLLKEMQEKKRQQAKYSFIGFAPEFTGNTDPNRRVNSRYQPLNELAMNVPEVEMIQSILKGDIYIREAATEANFVANASNYKIIHLATHGIADDQAGDFCYLAFTEQADSIENEILYVKELYPLTLNADMVVLSACETATGELKKGEGLVSIARGFSYAGAKSIITTLWSINDATTAKLMESFYLNIRSGKTKDAALCQAQRTFIKASRDQIAHPVYWAAFIPVGNMEPIELGFSGFSLGWTLIVLSFIGLLVLWWWKGFRI